MRRTKLKKAKLYIYIYLNSKISGKVKPLKSRVNCYLLFGSRGITSSINNSVQETKRSVATRNSRQDSLCPDAALPKAANIKCVQTATSIIHKEVWFCNQDSFAERRQLVSIITIQCSPRSSSKVVCLNPGFSEFNELIERFWRKTEQETICNQTWF